MRKLIDGLAVCVKQSFHLDPFSNSLFLFCGRRCDRLKALYWEGDGLLWDNPTSGRPLAALHLRNFVCAYLTFIAFTESARPPGYAHITFHMLATL
jgi:hypothetical protein